ncbi:hypothetical protein, partial [uncultured Duncaniella sp.]|uniref:hypothetical protein n=1 Tax=uncultured Duncaniella sp. TaxID=2768039 RepID=UPI002729EC9B
MREEIIHENQLFKEVHYQFLYSGLVSYYFCSRPGKLDFSRAAGAHVDHPQSDLMVADLSAFDR